MDIRTNQLWPIKSRLILEEKNIDIVQLKCLFKHILFPWNYGYNGERTYYSLRIQQRPLFIIKVISAEEIKNILDYVKEKNLTIRIVNGRHSTQLVDAEVL